jgi:hypothetical protein
LASRPLTARDFEIHERTPRRDFVNPARQDCTIIFFQLKPLIQYVNLCRARFPDESSPRSANRVSLPQARCGESRTAAAAPVKVKPVSGFGAALSLQRARLLSLGVEAEQIASESAPARFPLERNRSSDKKSRQITKLERILIAKVCLLLRNSL